MNTSLVENWTGFLALEKEWNPLLEDSRANSIFLTWEWIRAWAKIMDTSTQPFLVVARDNGGKLAAIAPLYLTDFRLAGAISFRTLRIMGDRATGAEYGDWILRADCEQESAQCLLDCLLEHASEWDCLWMPNMSGWSGCRETIVAACSRKGLFSQTRKRDFSCISLPGAIETFVEMLSPKRRKVLRYQARQFRENPDVTCVRCTVPDDLPDFLEALFELNQVRWAQKGMPGTFLRKPMEADFYRAFSRIALDRGWLRFYALKIGGEFKATQFGYLYGGIFHAMQEGFHPTLSPGGGNFLRMHVIAECIREGIPKYDFMGEMSDHKRRWNAKLRIGFDLMIGSRTLKNCLIFTWPVWPTGRFLRSKSVESPVEASI